jgi:hypothetical protein
MSLSSRFLIAMPPVLIASMYAAFWYFTSRLGFPNGYLAAFTVYWIGWCVLTPTLILGRRAVLNLFTTPSAVYEVRRHDAHTALVASRISAGVLLPSKYCIDTAAHCHRIDRAGRHHRCHRRTSVARFVCTCVSESAFVEHDLSVDRVRGMAPLPHSLYCRVDIPVAH